jgi:hypothetical protein
MVKTEVVNGTEGDILIKEGSAGVSRLVARVSSKGSHSLSVDENATYREYSCVYIDKGLSATITSDDLNENERMEIQYDERKPTDKRLFFERTARKRGISDKVTDASIMTFVSKIIKKLP